MEADSDFELKRAVEEEMARYGIDAKFDSDEDLEGFRRGSLLKGSQIRNLKIGDLVWIRIQEDDAEGYRANGAFRVTDIEGSEYSFSDGSIGGVFLNASQFKDADECHEDHTGWGWVDYSEALPR